MHVIIKWLELPSHRLTSKRRPPPRQVHRDRASAQSLLVSRKNSPLTTLQASSTSLWNSQSSAWFSLSKTSTIGTNANHLRASSELKCLSRATAGGGGTCAGRRGWLRKAELGGNVPGGIWKRGSMAFQQRATALLRPRWMVLLTDTRPMRRLAMPSDWLHRHRSLQSLLRSQRRVSVRCLRPIRTHLSHLRGPDIND